MSDGRQDAAALRRAFDQSFAVAPAPEIEHEDLLAIRVGGHPLALRVREISGFHPCPAITPMPSAMRELAGIVGLRGALVPVFDLQALLGLGSSATPRWLVLVGAPVIGLTFDELEQQLRVPESALVTSLGGPSRSVSRTTLATTSGPRPVLDLRSLHEQIATRARSGPAAKEKER